jgi:hypothetical protein
MRLHLRVVAAGGLALLGACGGGGGGRGSTAAPSGSFCEVILGWGDAVVATLNDFSRQSVNAADERARRGLYLEAWDGLDSVAPWVDTAAERAPAAARDTLHRAADSVRDELTDGRAHAVALPDDNYRYAAVSDGTLFTSSEKIREVVYQALDDLRASLGDAVPPACGRRPPVP